jgi:flagellar biogenesis protein FliO
MTDLTFDSVSVLFTVFNILVAISIVIIVVLFIKKLIQTRPNRKN